MRGIDRAVMENEGRKKAIKKRIYNRDLCGGGGEGCRFLFDRRRKNSDFPSDTRWQGGSFSGPEAG